MIITALICVSCEHFVTVFASFPQQKHLPSSTIVVQLPLHQLVPQTHQHHHQPPPPPPPRVFQAIKILFVAIASTIIPTITITYFQHADHHHDHNHSHHHVDGHDSQEGAGPSRRLRCLCPPGRRGEGCQEQTNVQVMIMMVVIMMVLIMIMIMVVMSFLYARPHHHDHHEKQDLS